MSRPTARSRLASLAAVCCLALMAAGCHFESSAELSEPGRIEQLTYAPATNGSGYSTSGNYVSTHTPEQFVVVISCPHGKFALNPTGDEARAIFQQFKQGDSITIAYVEKYVRRGDGPRELYDLDFLYAVKRGGVSR